MRVYQSCMDELSTAAVSDNVPFLRPRPLPTTATPYPLAYYFSLLHFSLAFYLLFFDAPLWSFLSFAVFKEGACSINELFVFHFDATLPPHCLAAYFHRGPTPSSPHLPFPRGIEQGGASMMRKRREEGVDYVKPI